MTTRLSERAWFALLAGATLLAWLGLLIHNVADLPGQTPLSPESFYPGLVSASLVLLWLVRALRVMATWALLVWAVVSLVGGGILSVLPLGLFPFTPEQSLRHYAFHAVYALTQVPLIWLCVARLRQAPKRRNA